MKRISWAVMLLMLVGNISNGCFASIPLRYMSGHEADLDKDGELDLAMLVETDVEQKLIVLLKRGDKYETHLLFTGKRDSALYLSCLYTKTLKETEAGPGKRQPRTYDVNGQYLLIWQPESAAFAYFWADGKFQKIWVSD